MRLMRGIYYSVIAELWMPDDIQTGLGPIKHSKLSFVRVRHISILNSILAEGLITDFQQKA